MTLGREHLLTGADESRGADTASGADATADADRTASDADEMSPPMISRDHTRVSGAGQVNEGKRG